MIEVFTLVFLCAVMFYLRGAIQYHRDGVCELSILPVQRREPRLSSTRGCGSLQKLCCRKLLWMQKIWGYNYVACGTSYGDSTESEGFEVLREVAGLVCETIVA